MTDVPNGHAHMSDLRAPALAQNCAQRLQATEPRCAPIYVLPIHKVVRRVGESNPFDDARDGERSPQAARLSPEVRARCRNHTQQGFCGLRTAVPVIPWLRS